MKLRKQTEAQLQAAVMQYLKYFYPKALAIHVPNEGKRNPRYVKSSGITAGVSDVLIFERKASVIHSYEDMQGLALELKCLPNKVTEKQLLFLRNLQERKWATKVCYSFDEAKEIIDWYLKK